MRIAGCAVGGNAREGECLGMAMMGCVGGDALLRLLLIDTCGMEGSIALADTARAEPWVEMVMLGGRTASERLIPELRGLIGRAGWGLRELAAVGVVNGPGSFTGVRVGVSAAKGLCEGAGVPLVAVSRLRVLAEKAGRVRTHAVLDAGRGEFFYGRFEAGEVGLEALLGREAVLAAVGAGGSVAVCEEGVREALAELGPVMVDGLTAVDALGLVRARVEMGAFDDVATADANYLRRTEMEVLERLAQRAAG